MPRLVKLPLTRSSVWVHRDPPTLFGTRCVPLSGALVSLKANLGTRFLSGRRYLLARGIPRHAFRR